MPHLPRITSECGTVSPMRPHLLGRITQGELHIILLCIAGLIAVGFAYGQCAR
jgi:hypothetical protein